MRKRQFNETTRAQLGQRLAEVRISQGVGQSELAGAIGVSDSRIRHIEHGRAPLKAEDIPLIAEVLACTIDDLYALPGSRLPRRRR